MIKQNEGHTSPSFSDVKYVMNKEEKLPEWILKMISKLYEYLYGNHD